MKELDTINKNFFDLLVRNNLLNPLIRSEIINSLLDNIPINKDMKNEIKSNIFKKENIKDDSEFDLWIKKKSTTEDKIYELISTTARLDNYCKKEYIHMAEARFLKRKNDLDTVTYSLIRVNEMFLAQELFLRLEENPSQLGDIASNYSTGAERMTRGIVGPVSLSKGHPTLVEHLKNAKIGEISQPKRIDNLWIIARVESRQISSLNEEMKLLMCKEIFNEHIDNQTKEKLQEIETKFQVLDEKD